MAVDPGNMIYGIIKRYHGIQIERKSRKKKHIFFLAFQINQ